MTVMICGGAGYIGSHTVRAFQSVGRSLVVVDTLEHGNQSAVGAAPFVLGDIGDVALVERVLSDYKITSVVHFAGYKAPVESMVDPGRYFANNVSNGLAMLGAAQRCGVRHIVFSSSCSVYGTPEVVPVAESAPLRPESAYGESKLMFEQILRWYDSCHAMRSVSLRYFNAAGAAMSGGIGEDWTRTSNLIPLVMKAALGRRGPIEIFGTDYPTPDGTAIRDYVHVDDVARAHVLALTYLEAGGLTTAVNLGTGVGSSVREILDKTSHHCGTSVPQVERARRQGDPSHVFANNSRARHVLRWEPRYGLDQILQSAWAWHSSTAD